MRFFHKNQRYRLRAFLENVSGYYIWDKKHLPVGTSIYHFMKYRVEKPPTFIFDVGANDGTATKRWSKYFPKAKIWAFEPVKSTFDKLVMQCENNDMVSCFNMALGAMPQKKEIRLHERYADLNSLVDQNMNHSNAANTEIVNVESLDNISCDEDQLLIDLLKIDTEGYDLEVLKGGQSMINENRIKFVYTETGFHQRNLRNILFSETLEYLTIREFDFLGLFEMDLRHITQHTQFGNALFIHRAYLSEIKGII